MAPWHIGNTTVRSPYRLREALRVLVRSAFHGNLVGKDSEEGFARLLHEQGVLIASRVIQKTSSDFSDLGRKWRSALSQLGFVVQHLTRGHRKGVDLRLSSFIKNFSDLSGRPYEITENGHRLIEAESLPAQQECFLRSLMAYRIPSILEPRYGFSQFSPLIFILKVLTSIESHDDSQYIKFEEMTTIIQLMTPEDGIQNVVKRVLDYRKKRNRARNKKIFDREAQLNAVDSEKQARTLVDYTDLTFRYLKATGLFQSKGRGIAIIPEKRALVEDLLKMEFVEFNDETYLNTLWSGADLPTDTEDNAKKFILSIVNEIQRRGEVISLPQLNKLSAAGLSVIRHDLEAKAHNLKEIDFARNQANAWEEILAFMEAFLNPRRQARLPNGDRIKIPSGEAPAYFEWIIWRAFLAIDYLINKPWEARRFKVDQDFLPVSTAPGHGPDMFFEFEDFVLVVEVTLSSSSRQEATEGEPVRRHVAETAERYEDSGKRVFGLFIAINIDSNTAETFKIGIWYKQNDSKLPLQIVPIKLEDFLNLFKFGFKSGSLKPSTIRELLVECRALSNYDAPEWKKLISQQIEQVISTK